MFSLPKISKLQLETTTPFFHTIHSLHRALKKSNFKTQLLDYLATNTRNWRGTGIQLCLNCVNDLTKIKQELVTLFIICNLIVNCCRLMLEGEGQVE